MINKRTYDLLKITIFGVFFSLFFLPFSTFAESSVDIQSESAIIVDAETGKILYAKNAELALPPASMTKMMTEYLVWEAIEQGKISWDTTTEISDYAYEISANPSFSGVGLRQNVDYTVRELYEAMAIYSDNGTTIALAELVAGTEGEFVRLMNEKAEEMGLVEYKFVNSTGLENNLLGDNYPEGTGPNDTNLLSARSAALLAYHLINDYPEALNISKVPQAEFDGHIINNWNRMLPHEGVNFQQYYYEGVDGLKTGYTSFAGYCFTGTAKKGDRRLITVIMKAESEDERFKETAKLLDYGFSNFETEQLFEEGYQLDEQMTIPVAKGKEKSVSIAINESIHLPIKKGEADKYSLVYEIDEQLLNEKGELVAPVEKGQKIGTAKIHYDGTDFGYIKEDIHLEVVDIVTTDDVEKSNWLIIMIQSIGEFFSNVFSKIVDLLKGLF